MSRRAAVLVLALVVLLVGALAVGPFLFEGDESLPPGLLIGVTRVASSDSGQLPRARAGTPLPMSVDSGSRAPAPAGTVESGAEPGRLVARLVNRPSGTGVQLGLVRCEPSDESSGEGEDISLGGDARRLHHVGETLDSLLETSTGELIWETLQPGAWQIVALPGSSHVPSGPSAFPARVRSGETTRVALELTPSGVILCRVESPDGEPVRGADVRLVGPLPPGFDLATTDAGDLIGVQVSRHVTDEEGRFEALGLSLGSPYGAHAWTADGVQATALLLSKPPASEPGLMVATMPLRLQVSVRESSAGGPLSGAQVSVTDNGLNRLRGISRKQSSEHFLRDADPTDEQGLTTVTVEPGSWLVVIHDDHDLETVQISEALAARDRVEIVLDRPDRAIVRVMTADGWPVRGARVEATVIGSRKMKAVNQQLASTTSDDKGEVPMADFGTLREVDFGGLRLVATHETAGVGGVQLDLGTILEGTRGLAKVIVLQRPGSLQIDIDPTGWNTPMPSPYNPRSSPKDVADKATREHLLFLKLCYLGSSSFRMEVSAQHGAERTADIQAWEGGLPQARFDDLEPGYYAVEIKSRARGVSFMTPSLRVLPGVTTYTRVEAPRWEAHARVILDIGPDLAGVAADFATLLPEGGPALYGPHVNLWSPEVGASDRRVRLDPSGRATFDLVPPGRYVIGVSLPDETGARSWHQTRTFQVGPGDDLHFDHVTKGAPPFGVLF